MTTSYLKKVCYHFTLELFLPPPWHSKGHQSSMTTAKTRRAGSIPEAPCKVNMTLPLAVIRSVLSLSAWKYDLQPGAIMPHIIPNQCHKVKSQLSKEHRHSFALYCEFYCFGSGCNVKRRTWAAKEVLSSTSFNNK